MKTSSNDATTIHIFIGTREAPADLTPGELRFCEGGRFMILTTQACSDDKAKRDHFLQAFDIGNPFRLDN